MPTQTIPRTVSEASKLLKELRAEESKKHDNAADKAVKKMLKHRAFELTYSREESLKEFRGGTVQVLRVTHLAPDPPEGIEKTLRRRGAYWVVYRGPCTLVFEGGKLSYRSGGIYWDQVWGWRGDRPFTLRRRTKKELEFIEYHLGTLDFQCDFTVIYDFNHKNGRRIDMTWETENQGTVKSSTIACEPGNGDEEVRG